MQYQQLGKSALLISKIGFGCMSLGNDEKENDEIISHALSSGINFFDTADLYNKGLNEVAVGKALKKSRKDVVIATKVGNQWRSDESGWDWNPRKDYILQAIERSLERLDTDYIDLYQLHGGTIQDNIDETIEAFEQLVQEGKIRYYGISSIRPSVIREWVGRSSIVSVMMQYSLLDRRPEETCFPLLYEKGIGVLVRGSLAQGLLVNKPPRSYLEYSAEEVKRAADKINVFSGKHRNESQTAIQFVLHHPAVTSAVVGIRNRAQLNEAVGTIDVPQLSDEEFEALQSILHKNYYK